MYATHYSYVWLYNDPPFQGTANWITGVDTHLTGPENVDVDTGFATGALMGDWLQTVGASVAPDVIPLSELRNDFTSSNAPVGNLDHLPSRLRCTG